MLPIQRILHPTDFSDLADEAFAYALDLAVRTAPCPVWTVHPVVEALVNDAETAAYRGDDETA